MKYKFQVARESAYFLSQKPCPVMIRCRETVGMLGWEKFSLWQGRLLLGCANFIGVNIRDSYKVAAMGEGSNL